MSICYAIKDWEKHFENSESRKIKSLTWVPMKNKHDGKGYRRVVSHPKSIQVFCAWCLLVQVASKTPVRGLLRDDDGPLQPSDLSDKTGFPASIFEEAFRVLSDPRVAWLVVVEKNGDVPAAPDIPGNAGIEQKGMEWNGIQQNGTSYSLKLEAKGGGAGEPGRGKDEHRTSNIERPTSNGVAEISTPHPNPSPRSSGGEGVGGSVPSGDGTAEDGEQAPPNSRILRNANMGEMVAWIQGNKGGWSYDNCKVAPADFSAGQLKTVLFGFIGRVSLGQCQAAWLAAVKEAHAFTVDGMTKTNPAAVCIGAWKRLMGEGFATETPSHRGVEK